MPADPARVVLVPGLGLDARLPRRGCGSGCLARRGRAAGRLVELPGAAHMTVQTHPDDVARINPEAAAGY